MLPRVSVFLLFFLLLTSPLYGGSVATIDKEELKAKLGESDLVIVDVRAGRDWSTSEFKIENAIRVDGKDLSPLLEFPKENSFVFYCA